MGAGGGPERLPYLAWGQATAIALALGAALSGAHAPLDSDPWKRGGPSPAHGMPIRWVFW